MSRTFTTYVLAAIVGFMLIVGPYTYYRYQYTRTKRLRVATPGVLYRAGQMKEAGIREAVQRFKIRTVLNLQNEAPDPDLGHIRESHLCNELGVRYIHIAPDLIDPRTVPENRPETIDAFLDIMDNPANHPVLIHCRAGLHRTGVLAALYRMEYENWSLHRAVEELKNHGFGDSKANTANDYIIQYLTTYVPRKSKRTASKDGGR